MAQPTLVQCVNSNSTDGNAVTKLRLEFQHDSLSGNAIAVFVSSGGAVTSVTDDKSNTYNSVVSVAGGQTGTWLLALNTTAGVRLVDINFTTATGFASAWAGEYHSVATASAVDGSNGTSGTGTSLTTGSFTPATTDTLVLAGYCQDTNNFTQTNFTPGSGFTALMHDRWNSTAFVQYKIHPTATSINPPCTMSPTNTWIGVGMALKNATAGTAPGSGIRIEKYQHNGINQAGGTTVDIFMPVSGNLIVLKWNDPAAKINSMSDDKSNTWVVGTSVTDTTVGTCGENQICYAANATGGLVKITLTLSAAFGAFICQTLDIVNADASPFVQTTSAHGANTTTNSTVAASITPAAANNLIVSIFGVDSATVTAVSAGQIMTNQPTPAITSPSPVDQNNGFAVQIAPNTTTITHTWTADAHVQSWAEVIAEFKPISLNIDPGYMLNYHR